MNARIIAAAGLLLSLAASAEAQVPSRFDPDREQTERQLLIAKLERDIAKVARSIEVTEELIARSRGAPYLPDIYLRLAELYVEQSRYEFYRVRESRGEGGDGAAVAPTSRLLKEKAIEIYRRILSEFPSWEDDDKVLFFMAHELRELGRYDEMIQTYRRLVQEHPKSELVLDAYLVLGDHAFDESDLAGAESWYRRVLEAPISPAHDIAHFKMGWVELNRQSFPRAFGHFEAAVSTAWAPPGGGRGDQRRLSIKREALSDLAYTYTEVMPAKSALTYFRRLSPSRNLYVYALDKLARRYFVKADYPSAANIYRELARLSHDPAENLDRTARVYEAVVESKSYGHVDQDVRQMLDAADQYRFDWRVAKAEREAASADAEVQARDLATRAQQLAMSGRDRGLGGKVADAYGRYLQSYPLSEHRREMVGNLADTLFEAGNYLEAGDRYEEAAITAGEGEQLEALYNACVAFRQALERGGPTLARFDRLWAQRGLIRNGRELIQRYPESPRVPEIELNIGRSYLEGGELERAVGVFEEFLDAHPDDKRVKVVAQLIIDAYAQREDYAGLAEAARAIAAKGIGGPAFARQLAQTAKAAEERQIGEVLLTASVDGNQEMDAGDRLRAYWEEHKDSPVAERTLYTAFVQYKEAKDFGQVFETGNQLVAAYPESTYLGDVFGTLAALSSQVGDFEQAAVYLEELATRFPNDASAREQRGRAARLRQLLGQHAQARASLAPLFDTATRPEDEAETGRALLETLRALGAWGPVSRVASKLESDELLPVRRALFEGLAALQSGRADAAERAFSEAAGAAGKASTPEVKVDAAEAAFRYGASKLERFRLAGNGADLARAAQAKAGLLEEVESAMVEALGFGVGEFAVAGLHRVGLAYAEMAGFLASAPVPEGLSDEDRATYVAAVREQAEGLEARSEELFSACVQQALDLTVLTEDTRGCLARGPSEPVAGVRPMTAGIPTGAAERDQLRAQLAQNPEDIPTILRMVELLLASGAYQETKLMAGRGLEVDDRNPRLHALIGAAELALGNASEAGLAYRRATELGHPFAAANLAALLASFGAEAAAASVLEGSSVEVPGSAPELHPDAMATVARLRR